MTPDKKAHSNQAPIGVFDSGIGGLSVMRAIRKELPGEHALFVADQAHVPYGPRPLEEVQRFSVAITHFLLEQGAKLIVVACNAASAAALHHLRQVFPGVPFVGMEPAVKPAAEVTRSGVVGVLATPATFQGALYASVIERFANGVTVLQNTCPGLVIQIEAGALDSTETRLILESALRPMLAQGIDTVVLGCTHYPFVIPLIQEISGPNVRVIDPAPAIARQVRRMLADRNLLAEETGEDYAQGNTPSPSPTLRFFTTGDPGSLQVLLPQLLGEGGTVLPLSWNEGRLNPSVTGPNH